MSALLFPGQGSQVVGMGLEFYNKFDLVKKIFKEADDSLNYKISKIILEGPADKLQLTENTQPGILTVSYSIFRVMKDEFNFDFNLIDCFAGHSLGEYSALVSSNSLKFNDAIYLLHERGKAMQEAVPLGEGSMLAILGLDIEKINEILADEVLKNSICEIANDNATGQVIISGEKSGIDKLTILLKERKIKSIPLKVSAPFHCSMMKPAAEKMREKIEKTTFINPDTRIILNVTAKEENSAEKIKEMLIKQIFSTVRWRESITNISKMGTNNFIEIGPGKALIGMIKRTIKNANCFSINSLTDIKNLENELKK